MATLTVYGDTADNYIQSTDFSVYANARAGTGTLAIGSASGTTYYTGQDAGFRCYQIMAAWNTSALTSVATVTAVVLDMYGGVDSSTTDFTIEARLHDWGTSVTTADYVAGASLSGKTLLATFATSGFNASGYNTFTNVAFPANVNKTGVTRILLCSSRQTNNNQPTNDEYVGLLSADNTGTTQDPKLTITYTLPAGPSIRRAPLRIWRRAA